MLSCLILSSRRAPPIATRDPPIARSDKLRQLLVYVSRTYRDVLVFVWVRVGGCVRVGGWKWLGEGGCLCVRGCERGWDFGACLWVLTVVWVGVGVGVG